MTGASVFILGLAKYSAMVGIILFIVVLGMMIMMAQYRVIKLEEKFIPEKLSLLFFWSRFDDLSFETEEKAIDWCKQQLDASGKPDVVWRS